MLDINKILNWPLKTEPWTYQIIDNMWSDDDFAILEQAAINLLNELPEDKLLNDGKGPNYWQVRHIIGEDAFNLINDSNRAILDNIEKILNYYPESRKYDSYYSSPTFNILREEAPYACIHDENVEKVLSVCTYIYDKDNIGTHIYRENNEESLYVTEDWKQNRAFVFCGVENKTWHGYTTKKNPRVTLNYFVRKRLYEKIIPNGDKMTLVGIDGYPSPVVPYNQTLVDLVNSKYIFRDM